MSDTPIFDDVERMYRAHGKSYESLVRPVVVNTVSNHQTDTPPPETVKIDSKEDTAELIVFQSAEVKPLSLRNNPEA